MITFFRRIIGSKFGAIFAVIFLGMIAFAFVAGDIEHKSAGGGFSFFGGGPAAKVGHSAITEQDLQSRVQRIFEQQRRESPGLPFAALLAQDGVNQIYDQLVSRLAAVEFAASQGVYVSKRMVDAQIASIPAFHDAAGKFSQTAFRQFLTGQAINEKQLRDDIAMDITERIIKTPAMLGTRLPDGMVLPYASLLLEARQGRIGAIPSAAFVPAKPPSEAQLTDFYRRNAARFMLPEQRKLRYAIIDAERFAAAATPSEPEISVYYTKNKAAYAARETRSIEQLILPTEAAARAALGKPLAASAQAAGLSVSTLGALGKSDLARQTSDAIANAAFAAPQGGMAGPLRSALGWAVIRVSAIQKTPETTLAQAHDKIVEALIAQKQAQLLSDFTAKLEDQSANGATFDEIVKDNGLTTEETPLLVGTGQNVNDPAYQPSTDVVALLKAGFDMEADDEPQLAPITPQKRYALVDVNEVVAAAPPPLAKVRTIVEQQYALHEGAVVARTFADALAAKIRKGMPMDQALAGAHLPLPPSQQIGGRRGDLMRDDKRPPAEIALLFAIPKGAVKVMPIGNDRGYFIIQLQQIAQGDAAQVPGLVDQVRGGLKDVVANEYGAQFNRAMERDLGAKRNPDAVARVTQELKRINGGSAAQ